MSEWVKLMNSVVPKIAAIKAREMLRDLDVMEAILNLNSNSTLDDRERRKLQRCSRCKPNRGENTGRRPKHGEKKPRYKDH